MLALMRSSAVKACPDVLPSLRAAAAAISSSATTPTASPVAAHAETAEPTTSSISQAVIVKDEHHLARLQAALQIPIQLHPSASQSSPSEIESALELFRLHNSSMQVAGGHMIKARVLQADRRKITLDTGLKMAKIAVSDITPECILQQVPSGDGTPRTPGTIIPGDIVQVYLEHEETPEGDMLVSGQQAAVRRRVRAVWKELQDRMQDGRPVKGRVLNSLAGGYAVGVAGLVCFLPNRSTTKATSRRIGELQNFKVIQMNPARNNVVVYDWRMVNNNNFNNRGGGGGGNAGNWRQRQQQYQQQQQQQKPPPRQRIVKEAAGLTEDLEKDDETISTTSSAAALAAEVQSSSPEPPAAAVASS